jgi:hypothetical protein
MVQCEKVEIDLSFRYGAMSGDRGGGLVFEGKEVEREMSCGWGCGQDG